MTRKPIIVFFVVAAALLGETQISNAQSAYSYPWCAVSVEQRCSASAETVSRAHITMRTRHSWRALRW
jgi:hypothetical protein